MGTKGIFITEEEINHLENVLTSHEDNVDYLFDKYQEGRTLAFTEFEGLKFATREVLKALKY